MKKLLLLIFITLALSITAVSATDNITEFISDGDNEIMAHEVPITEEIISEEAQEEPVQSTVQNEPVSANESSEEPVKTTSKITTSNVKGYTTFTSTLKIKLTSNNTAL